MTMLCSGLVSLVGEARMRALTSSRDSGALLGEETAMGGMFDARSGTAYLAQLRLTPPRCTIVWILSSPVPNPGVGSCMAMWAVRDGGIGHRLAIAQYNNPAADCR